MNATSTSQRFERALRRQRRGWQAGLLTGGLLGGLACGLLALLLAALWDLAFPLPDLARGALRWALLAVVTVAAIVAVIRTLVFGELAAAIAADQAERGRRPVRSAWELLRQPCRGDTELHAFLVERAAAQGRAHLTGLKPGRRLPLAWLRRHAGRALVAALTLALSFVVSPIALRTAVARIARPADDIPPFSRLRFEVVPAQPVVAYGGSTSIVAVIRGGPVRGAVWLVTRQGRRERRTACFQEAPGRFGQRLDQVVQPLDFCFATTRVRSPWHRVEVRTQPQIALAELMVQPPAYSALPAERLFAGREPIRALRGSAVTLRLLSNRPLLDGALHIRSLADGQTAEVAGTRDGDRAVRFEWMVRVDAEIEAQVRDVQGAWSRQPLRLVQQVRPDTVPEVALSDPPVFALATPSGRLPVAGQASDDLGLRRVDIVRTVVGYRDRSLPVPVLPGQRAATFESSLDLAALGVIPGQTLEFYAEAADSNPSLAGLGASPVATVRIISDDDYAALLRTRATVEHLSDRFAALADRLQAYREALEALRDAGSPGTDAATRQAALARALAEGQATQTLAKALADDFAIYDLEKRQQALIGESLASLNKGVSELEAANPAIARLAPIANGILEALGGTQRAVADQAARAAVAEQAGQVMALAMDFKALVERQRLTLRALERIEHSTRPADREQAPFLGDREGEIERQLQTFVAALRAASGSLPDELGDLRASAQAFAAAADTCGASTNLLAAAGAARALRTTVARREAREALDRLEALLSRAGCEAFGGMCQSNRMLFQVPDDLESTLAQMLAAMLAGGGGRGGGSQPADGTGAGGLGLGGDPSDGFWMQGSTPLAIPTYGPGRMPSGGLPGMGVTGGSGHGARGGPETAMAAGASRPAAATPSDAALPAAAMELLPGRYREALRRYFGEGGGR